MAIFTCKMCGATLGVEEGKNVATCNYCGTAQTLPKQQNEIIANLFNRANQFRLNSEFDKAQALYEKIIEDDVKDPEAHWGVVLCKYGIEYVEDSKTKTRIPTCHRTQIESVLTDVDYKEAIKLCDSEQKKIYQVEAKAIDKIQQGILSIVREEEPYDIFLCYKETDENGVRTSDSVTTNEIYYELTKEGYKVFYAPITLENKLGQEYEPYIFAALNSAKIMLVVGTKTEYFNAPWVKNEWSRYLKLMKTDKNRLLIPCYRDMNPYDLPEEFAHLQAQDMIKIGFMQDIIRGIKKIFPKEDERVVVKETVMVQEVAAAQSAAQSGASPNIASFLKRAKIFLEDGNEDAADEYAEKVLDIDPECADAYMLKLCLELGFKRESDLAKGQKPFWENVYYAKAKRYATGTRLKQIEGYYTDIMENWYNGIAKKMGPYLMPEKYERLAEEWEEMPVYKDSKEQAKKCREMAKLASKNVVKEENYQEAMAEAEKQTAKGYRNAIALLKKYPDWKDAERLIVLWAEQEKEANYKEAKVAAEKKTPEGYKEGAALLRKYPDWKDSKQLIEEWTEQEKETVYKKAKGYANMGAYISAVYYLEPYSTWKDAEQLLAEWRPLAEKERKKYKRQERGVLFGNILFYLIAAAGAGFLFYKFFGELWKVMMSEGEFSPWSYKYLEVALYFAGYLLIVGVLSIILSLFERRFCLEDYGRTRVYIACGVVLIACLGLFVAGSVASAWTESNGGFGKFFGAIFGVIVGIVLFIERMIIAIVAGVVAFGIVSIGREED